MSSVGGLTVLYVASQRAVTYNAPMHDDSSPRRRITAVLFVANALSWTAFIAVVTVAALAAERLTGSARYAGVPSALGTLGSALGAYVLTQSSGRFGRRPIFSLGFLTAGLGAAVGALALVQGRLPLLFAGMLLLGFGRSVSQLLRYAAGDLWTDEKRASAMAFIVWAATIGSVLGPLMVLPTSRWGTLHWDSDLAGPYAFCALGFAASALWVFAFLRPEPLKLAKSAERNTPTSAQTPPPKTVPTNAISLLRSRPTVQLGFLVLVVAQGVMTLVMTMTPVHIHGHGHGLSLVSGVMASHTLGMFALSPLTGRLADRLGARPMIILGSGLMALSGVLAASAQEAEAGRLTLGLFLLGVGWNFSFVAGSTVFQEGLELSERLRLQGLADALTWTSAGLSAMVSGFVVSATSFPALALGASIASLLPLAALRMEAHRSRISPETGKEEPPH